MLGYEDVLMSSVKTLAEKENNKVFEIILIYTLQGMSTTKPVNDFNMRYHIWAYDILLCTKITQLCRMQ